MAGRKGVARLAQEQDAYPEITQYFRMLVLPTALFGYSKKRVIDALQCLDGLYRDKIAEIKEEFARKIAWEITGKKGIEASIKLDQSGKELRMKERMEFQQLKKMGKNDLLRLLQECDDENRRLKTESEANEKKIQEMKILIDKVEEEKKKLRISCTEPGSLAESMLQVNGVMEAAQRTADQYIARIRELEAVKQKEADAMIDAARSSAEQILMQAKEGAQRMKAASTNVLKTLQDEIDHMLTGARGAFEQKGDADSLPVEAPPEYVKEELRRVPHLNEILATSESAAAQLSGPSAAMAAETPGSVEPLGRTKEDPPAAGLTEASTQEYAQYEAFLEEVDKFTANLNDEIKNAMDDITSKTQQSGQ